MSLFDIFKKNSFFENDLKQMSSSTRTKSTMTLPPPPAPPIYLNDILDDTGDKSDDDLNNKSSEINKEENNIVNDDLDISEYPPFWLDKIEKNTSIPYEKLELVHLSYPFMNINEHLLKKMEQNPELIELLINHEVSNRFSILLSQKEVCEVPDEDLKYIKYLDFDENTLKHVSLLNNRVDVINDDYFYCSLDLSEDLDVINYDNKINSLIPNIDIKIGSEVLTKTSSYSKFGVYLPKTKYREVYHKFHKYVVGQVDLNEDVIIKMGYYTFLKLDQSIINKISKCKLYLYDDFSREDDFFREDGFYREEIDFKDSEDTFELDYSLLKKNHLIYVIENSSLEPAKKDKILYNLKNKMVSGEYIYEHMIKDMLTSISVEEIQLLTKQFENNIDLYKNKVIEKPNFNANYYIEDNFPDLEQRKLNDVVDFVRNIPDSVKPLVLRNPRIIRKLNLPQNLTEQIIEKIIILLNKELDNTTMEFVNRMNFDFDKFMNDSKNNYFSSSDINPIISKYGVFDNIKNNIEISVADILGHDYSKNNHDKNILYTFSDFYIRNGDSYHSRSLELLNYTSGEELLTELKKRNNDTKDMKVQEFENGKYVIYGNGLHRFSVLRFHYLLDCMKNEKSEQELREVYKIPVKLESKTNYKRTYSNYIIQKAYLDIDHISFNPDENEIIIYYKSNKEKSIIGEEEFYELVIKSVDMLDSNALDELTQNYYKYDSFRDYIDNYLPQLIPKKENEDTELMKR